MTPNWHFCDTFEAETRLRRLTGCSWRCCLEIGLHLHRHWWADLKMDHMQSMPIVNCLDSQLANIDIRVKLKRCEYTSAVMKVAWAHNIIFEAVTSDWTYRRIGRSVSEQMGRKVIWPVMKRHSSEKFVICPFGGTKPTIIIQCPTSQRSYWELPRSALRPLAELWQHHFIIRLCFWQYQLKWGRGSFKLARRIGASHPM